MLPMPKPLSKDNIDQLRCIGFSREGNEFLLSKYLIIYFIFRVFSGSSYLGKQSTSNEVLFQTVG